MRNFWLEADIDGRETLVTGGPRCKDGGMSATISMRDEGVSVIGVRIRCYERNGTLAVDVYDDNGELIYSKTTER